MIGNESDSFGKPWKYRYDLINKDISNDWREELSLPISLTYFQAANINNKIFIMGGYNNKEYTTNVYSYKINENGTLIECKSEIPLPNGKSYAETLLIKNKLYLIGGRNTNNTNEYYYNSDTLIGTINDKGDIEEWNRSLSLFGNVYGTHTISIKNRIFIIGGSYTTDVLAHISALILDKDGIIKNHYYYAGRLFEIVANGQIIAFKDKIHLLGGYKLENVYYNHINFIQSSSIDDNGDIKHWTRKEFLPIELAHFQAIIIGNKVFILGGLDNNRNTHSTIYMSIINEDGTLSEFIEYSYLPEPLYDFETIVTDNRLYIIGGINRNNEISNKNRKISNKIYSTAII